MAIHFTGIGIAQFFGRRFDLALPRFLTAIQQMPSYQTPYRFGAACHAHLGRLAEAHDMAGRLRAMKAEVEPRITHWRKPEHQELLRSGLRLAMRETG